MSHDVRPSSSTITTMLPPSYPPRRPPPPPPPPPPSVQSIPTASASSSQSQLQPSHTSNANGHIPHPPTPSPARPQPERDLPTSQIISILLPTVVWPVHIGYEFDLDDAAECQSLLSQLNPDSVGDNDNPWLDYLVGSPGQGSSDDPGLSSSRKGRREDEDEDMHMANVREPFGSLSVGFSGGSKKGKEKATLPVSDAETESVWPAAFRRSAIPAQSPRSKARVPNGSGSKSSSENSSGSGHRRAGAAPSTSRCISNTSSSGSFSPVDWTKMKSGQDVQVLKLSPNAKLLLNTGRSSSSSGGPPKSISTKQTSPGTPTSSIKDLHAGAISPSPSRQSVMPPQAMAPSRSYTLPPHPEGSIAALRQETQGLAYPNSYAYSATEKDKGDVEEKVSMVIGADAGERMLSPESQNSGEEDEGESDVANGGLEKKDKEERDTGTEDVHMEVQAGDTSQARKERGAQNRTVAPAPKSESASTLQGSASASTMDEDMTVSAPSVGPAVSSLIYVPSSASTPILLASMQDSGPSSHALSASSASPVAAPVIDSNSVEAALMQEKAENSVPMPNSQSTSGTAEDEAQVQSLILDALSPATSPVKPALRATTEFISADADVSVHTVRGVNHDQRRSPTQDMPTPRASTSILSTDALTSRPIAPAFSLPSIEVETKQNSNGDMNMDEEIWEDGQISPDINKATPEVNESVPGAMDIEHGGGSSPLFTSPAKPPYGDVSWHTEDFDLNSSPSRLAAKEGQGRQTATEEVVSLQEEPITPRAVPLASSMNGKAMTSPKYIDSLAPSPVKAPSTRIPPDKPKKARDSVKSPEFLSISSDEEMEVKQPLRARVRHRKPRKLHLFDDPADEVKIKQEPVIIDITTPVRASSRDHSEATSPLPAPATVIEKVNERDITPLTPLPSRSNSVSAHAVPETAPDNEKSDSEREPLFSFDVKKHAARLNDDDDAEVVRVKAKKRKVSNTGSLATTDAGSTVAATESNSGDVNMSTDTNGNSYPAKRPQLQPRTLLLGLLANKAKKQSAALTRIKKRKRSSEEEEAPVIQEDEEEEEYDNPPLKRAKLRKGGDGSKDKPASKPKPKVKESEKKLKEGISKVKIKEKEKDLDSPRRYPLRSPTKVKPENISPSKTPTRRPRGQQQKPKWPEVKKPNFDQYVNCDVCYNWYHIGCVGVEPDDVRLRPSEMYTCPICQASSEKDDSPAKNANRDADAASECHRPDCIWKKKRKSQVVEEPQQMFVVEAFVGRCKKFVGGVGMQQQYLVKWHGYDFNEATWEPLESMGLTDPGPLLHTFEKEAKAQGVRLDDGREVVLFKEAAEAGWKPDRTFVKRG